MGLVGKDCIASSSFQKGYKGQEKGSFQEEEINRRACVDGVVRWKKGKHAGWDAGLEEEEADGGEEQIRSDQIRAEQSRVE